MFSYFVPNQIVAEKAKVATLVRLTPDVLARLGLSHVGSVVAKQISTGPTGSGGWLLYREAGGQGAGQCDRYLTNTQTWQPMAFPSDIWIGYETARGLPGPQSLERESQLPGQSVTLGDSKSWLVPAAVEYDDDLVVSCRLPRTIEIQSTGEWMLGDVVPIYRYLWKSMQAYKEAESAAIGRSFVFAPLNDWCIAALTANYYLGPSESLLLGLLDQMNRSRIIAAIMDYATGIEILQKKRIALATGDTPDGHDVSTPEPPAITDQATPTGPTTT